MTEGSLRTIPLPFMYTKVLAVPKSIARSRAISETACHHCRYGALNFGEIPEKAHRCVGENLQCHHRFGFYDYQNTPTPIMIRQICTPRR
jgi:hypothetical protein